jgi:hypothetical protein
MGTVRTEPPRSHPHLGTPSRTMGMRSAGVSATHDGDVERASAMTVAVLSSSPSSRRRVRRDPTLRERRAGIRPPAPGRSAAARCRAG